MQNYQIEYSYKIPEYGLITLQADDVEHAEEKALVEIKDMFPDVVDISVEGVRELK